MVQRSHENGEFDDREWEKERSERHDNWGGYNEGAGHTRELREWKKGRCYEDMLGKKEFQKWKIFQSRQTFETTHYNKVDKFKKTEGVLFIYYF